MSKSIPTSALKPPLVSVSNNRVIAKSTDIANEFGKQHFHVLRSIENLKSEAPKEFTESIFGFSEYTDSTGRKLPYYELTRDGFALLVMGFTGKKALQFKIAYIEAFNAMEAALLRISVNPTAPKLTGKSISPAQQRELQEAVTKVAHSAPAMNQRHAFKTLYGSIKSKYRVGTYKDLDEACFNDALEFVHTYKWDLLDAPAKPALPAPAPEPVAIEKYNFPKELLLQKHFCGQTEGGKQALPRLNLLTFADAKWNSVLALLLAKMHEDGHNIDGAYGEFMAMVSGIKSLADQLSPLNMIGHSTENAALKMLFRN